MTDPTPYDQDAADGELAELDDQIAVGDVVTVRWLDTATGADVVHYGTVVDVLHQDSGPAVRVGLFGQVSAPLPLDHELHGRIDAPRVSRAMPWEVLGTVDGGVLDDLSRGV